MIDLCWTGETQGLRPFDRAALIAQLETMSVAFRRVDEPTPGVICLLFASLESDAIMKLTRDTRKYVVLVAEGDEPPAEKAEATRDALGLLGIVEPGAWRNWQRGLFVAWGLYGRSDVATQAGLIAVGTQGLQPADHREALPATLARFLLAAERTSP